VCKILSQEEIKPHKVRYYLRRRDAEFEQKMAQVLCVYREVQILKKVASKVASSAGPAGCGRALGSVLVDRSARPRRAPTRLARADEVSE
jgi:hypothetical protein